LDDCILFELTADIRKIAIELKRRVKIKTPDSIVAATAMSLQIPLITSDKDFKSVPGLELILI
jgi:predicted nucleic acid-binding protein